MKKAVQSFLVLSISVFFLGCSGDDNQSNTSNDPIAGKWKQVSETVNGVPEEFTSCDLQEVSEFKPNGDFTAEDYDLVNGQCVLNNPSEPGVTFKTTWTKSAENSYRIDFIVNNQPTLQLNFTTVFSNDNNTMTTTATEPDGDIVVSVSNRV